MKTVKQQQGWWVAPGDPRRQPEVMSQSARLNTPGACASFSGRWINHLGSILELTVQGHAVSGRILIPPEAAHSHRRGAIIGELSGMAVERLSTLTCRWEGRTCLAALIGELIESDGNEMIMFSWELVRALVDPDRPVDLTLGQATFIRLPSH